jgi:aarF domain-containing kinase
MSMMNVTQLLPKGMYVENLVKVMKRELMDECDYIREANCNIKFGELFKNDEVFVVPKVYKDSTTKRILVTQLVDGLPFDKCVDLTQEQRNFVSVVFYLVT